MKIVVGLGNPGREYEETRHNLGKQVVQGLFGGALFKLEKKLQAEIGRVTWQGEGVILALPTTYMNLSGEAVQKVLAFFKEPAVNLLVLHDEIDLPEFEIRYKNGGGHRGHNGLRHIIQCIGTNEFHRIRLGVGRPVDSNYPVADYVLSKGPAMPPGFISQVESLIEEKNLLS